MSNTTWSIAFSELTPPAPHAADEPGYAVRVAAYAPSEGVRFGKDSVGRAVFLVGPYPSAERPQAAVDVPNLYVQHGCPVSLIDANGNQWAELLTLIICRSESRALQELFVAFQAGGCGAGGVAVTHGIACGAAVGIAGVQVFARQRGAADGAG